MQVLSCRRGLIISAHPFQQIRHLLRAVDPKADGGRRFLCRPFSAVDVVVYLQRISEIPLNDKGPAAVVLNQRPEDLRLQLLILPDAVAGLAQSRHLYLLRNDDCVKVRLHGRHIGSGAPGASRQQDGQAYGGDECSDVCFSHVALFLK